MPRVLSVGQCGFDHGRISRHFVQTLGAEVTRADTFPEALVALRAGRFDLVLVNRVTDEDGSLGVELIDTLKRDPTLTRLPVMLVSNFAEAQAEAESLGALTGFGKSDMAAAQTTERIKAAIANRSSEISKG